MHLIRHVPLYWSDGGKGVNARHAMCKQDAAQSAACAVLMVQLVFIVSAQWTTALEILESLKVCWIIHHMMLLKLMAAARVSS